MEGKSGIGPKGLRLNVSSARVTVCDKLDCVSMLVEVSLLDAESI